MKLRFPILAGLSLLPLMAAADVTATRYVVTFPHGEHVPYEGRNITAFPHGLPVGVGSGLLFVGKQGDALNFVTVTDRGPNADSPKAGKRDAKIFASPSFTPQLLDIQVKDGKAEAGNARALHDEQGKISGLPLPEGTIGATNELALDDSLHGLGSDKRGLDVEGITSDGAGGYWICDEYGPFLIHIDQQGRIVGKFGPEAQAGEQSVAGGLPNIIKWRQANRGFEGLTRMADGRIMAAVQSTLDIDGKTKNSAGFTRLVAFDPATGKSAMYGYPINTDYKKAKDAKIGDVVALDDHRLLVLEQGADKNKTMQNRIYLVDISKASDLSGFDAERAAEFDDAAALAKRGITLASKQLLVDLRALGWQQEKAEGMALVDGQTLAITNDNDFGLAVELVDPANGKEDMDDYQVDGKGGLLQKGKPVSSRLVTKSLTGQPAKSELWLVKLSTPL